LSFPNFRRSFGAFLFFLALSGLSFLRRSIGAFLYFPWSIIDYIMPLRFPLPAPNRRRRSLFFLIGFLPQKTIRLQTPSTSLFLLSHWVPTRNRQSGSKHRRRRSLFFLIGYFPQQTIRLQTPSTSLSLSSFSLDSIHQRQRFSTTVHVAISLLSLGVQSRPDNPVHEHRRRLYLFLLSRFNLDSFQLRQSGQPTPSTSLFSFFHMRHSHVIFLEFSSK
jgi:hypothetical protein